MITTRRVVPGQFEVYKDDIKTKYVIMNGDLGASGRATNMYGILDKESGKITWVGSLQKCKKMVAHWITC